MNTNPDPGTPDQGRRRAYIPRRVISRVAFKPPTTADILTHAAASIVLVPSYALAAAAIGTPGMRFHVEAVDVAARLLFRGGVNLLSQAGRLALYPMDSTRYFEFDWIWSRLMGYGRVTSYLDVSSPRLLPLCYLRRATVARGSLLNPDAADLDITRRWAVALGLSSKTTFIERRVEASGLEERFEVITAISVVEHIIDDSQALSEIRARLVPGGRLLLTLPCAGEAYDQYREHDEYNVVGPGPDGRFFFQRFYDSRSLRERVFSVMGAPTATAVYGEREPGFFGRNAERKMRGLPYPFWREGYMMGRHFQVYPSVDALPGEGVVALEFIREA